FNVREGVSRADDELPAKLQEPLDSGPNAGAAIDTESFDAMLDEYYSQRGWDADGRPTPETIERLGLTDAVDQSTRPADTTLGE
ncbi:aldehyde ferredoxin oxidoreductase, partial [Haloarcula hispanica]